MKVKVPGTGVTKKVGSHPVKAETEHTLLRGGSMAPSPSPGTALSISASHQQQALQHGLGDGVAAVAEGGELGAAAQGGQCDPIDGSPTGSPVPGILQARTLEWVAISFSNA